MSCAAKKWSYTRGPPENFPRAGTGWVRVILLSICPGRDRPNPLKIAADIKVEHILLLVDIHGEVFTMTTNFSDSGVSNANHVIEAGMNESSSLWNGIVTYLHSGWSSWQLALTILLLLMTYDQGITTPTDFCRAYFG
jgi:hypothetical protein